MTRIPVHTVESASEGSRDALKALEAKFGKVLNIHGAMAHSPSVLQTYVAIQQVLQDTGTLDTRLREVVALAVANVDECSYCQAAHTAGGPAAGLSEQQSIFRRMPFAPAPGGQVTEPAADAVTPGLTVWSTSWCGYCHRLMEKPDRAGVAYTSVDIERDPEATRYVMQVNGGSRTVPTVVFADGTALTNPSLEDVLARTGT